MHTCSGFKPLKTSSFVNTKSVKPFKRTAYFKATRSSQPVRRGRPVVDPNSSHGLEPVPRSRSPMASFSSVGNGPAPTREQKAFATPMTRVTYFGPTPRLVKTPPAMVEELVTNG